MTLRTSFLPALILVSCAGPTPLEVSETTSIGLRQRVSVSDVNPSEGDTLRVVSVILNPLTDGLEIRLWDPCLDLSGTLPIRIIPPDFMIGNCSVVPMILAPGESVTAAAVALLTGPAGTYNLEIQHLVEPAWTVAVEVRVSN